MPTGVLSLETVWCFIIETCKELEIPYTRTGIFATLDELDDILTDVEWLWKGWIPKGFISMLVGDPGVGKSLLAMDLCRRITNGEKWPLCNDAAPSKGYIFWLDTEASQQLMRIRAIKLGLYRKRIAIPVIDGDILGKVDISIQEHREMVVNTVEAVHPQMIIIDSLSGSYTRGENKVEDIRPIMEFYALLSRDYKVSVLITHHLNKNQTDSPEIALYRMRGSTVIPQFARSILALEKIGDNTSKLRVIKSNLARIGEPISITSEVDDEEEVSSLTYEQYTAPPRKRTKKELCANWVIDTLKSGHELQLKELEEIGVAVGYTRGNLYAAKDMLGERITVTGTGKAAFWHLTENDDQSINQISSAHGENHG